MSYFATALAALVAAECLMATGYGFPAAPIEAPETLVLVHVVALGWLSLLMSGALLQFVPVLVARPLFSDRLPLPALGCLVTGLAALLLGFLQLGGEVAASFPFLPVGGILLGSGFALNLWNLAGTLWPVRPLPLPARFVAVGLLSLAATTILGIIFALVLAGATAKPHLLAVTAAGVPIHAIAGLGGWLTFSAIGVSYRLLAMFMLAPELDGPSTRATFWLGTCALASAILGGTAAACIGRDTGLALVAAAALGIAAIALYGFDIVKLYRARQHPTVELNTRMAGFALASLAAAAVLILVTALSGRLPQQAGAIAYLTAFGWLTGLGLAKLYKIVPFLTWLECYGPVLGKRPTPRVQDLVAEARAARWFWLYFGAVWVATGSLLASNASVFRIAAGASAVATVGIIVELIRARRLADVSATVRLPDGARRPRLLFSASQHA
jgi:hypothetical protein